MFYGLGPIGAAVARQVVARKGFTVARIRKLLQVLKTRFKTRLYDAIEGGGPVTLFIDGDSIYARNPFVRNGLRPGQDLRLPPPTR